MDLDTTLAALKALSQEHRLRAFRALVAAGDAGLPVGRLQARLDIAPSTLSHHLKALVVVGLVEQRRDGTTLNCHANYGSMRDLLGFLAEECCADGAGSCAPPVLPRLRAPATRPAKVA